MRARRRALVPQGRGRLLDLGGADSHRTLWHGAADVTEATVLDGIDDPRLARLDAEGERFDTVVSVFQLAAATDLGTTLRALGRLLDDRGRLLFVEPGVQRHVPERLQRLLAPPFLGPAGWRARRDIPAELRAARLSVTDIRRHRVPTLHLRFRQVLDGVAHHALEPGTGPLPSTPTEHA